MSYEILSPETVQQIRDAGPKDLIWLLADSHEALRERVAQFERHVETVIEPELIRRADWLYQDADAKYHQIVALEAQIEDLVGFHNSWKGRAEVAESAIRLAELILHPTDGKTTLSAARKAHEILARAIPAPRSDGGT